MHATPPTARLPLHVPHKHGMALRHLLKFDHAQSPENKDEPSSVVIAICFGLLTTMCLTLVCIFIVWHYLKKKFVYIGTCSVKQVKRAGNECTNCEKCQSLQITPVHDACEAAG